MLEFAGWARPERYNGEIGWFGVAQEVCVAAPASAGGLEQACAVAGEGELD